MKNLFFIFILSMVVACSNNKSVYWCGDHPCINKKEKEAYFKKTMIVEIKDLKNKNYKSRTEYERIMQQAQLDEKKRIKGEKNLAKHAKLEEKKRIKGEKKSYKRKIYVNKEKQLKKAEIDLDEFSELVEKITKMNTFKPYPDINEIPN